MPRKRREDYLDCGTLFSDWEILVAPSLGEELQVGGSYELGVLIPNQAAAAKGAGAIKSCDVLPVYLGESERNLKAVLARYGSGSSHLPEECFQQVSKYGGSLVFRCGKHQLEVKEELLQKLDYAWNARGNGCRRPADVDRCLKNAASGKRSAGTNLGIRVESEKPGCFFVEKSDKNLAELLQWMNGQSKETSSTAEGGEKQDPAPDWRKFLLPIPALAGLWSIDIVYEGKGGLKYRQSVSHAGNSCSVTSRPRLSEPGGNTTEASCQTRIDATLLQQQSASEADLASTASTGIEEFRTDGLKFLPPTVSALRGASPSGSGTSPCRQEAGGSRSRSSSCSVSSSETVPPTTGKPPVGQGADGFGSNIKFSFGDTSPVQGPGECEVASSSPDQSQPDVLSRSMEDVGANVIAPPKTDEVEDVSGSFLEQSRDITCHNVGSQSSGTSGELEMKFQKLALETLTEEHSQLTPTIHIHVPRRVITPDKLDTLARPQASGLRQLLLDPLLS